MPRIRMITMIVVHSDNFLLIFVSFLISPSTFYYSTAWVSSSLVSEISSRLSGYIKVENFSPIEVSCQGENCKVLYHFIL